MGIRALFFVMVIVGCGPNYLKNGLRYLDESNYSRAEIEFKKSIAKNPNDAKGHVNLGIAYVRQGKFPESISAFETAIRADQTSADAYNNLAFAYAEKNIKLDSALYYAKKAMELRPNDANILDTMAWVYYKKGLYNQALELANDMISFNPKNQQFQGHLKAISQKVNRLREVWVRLGPQNLEGGLKLLDIESDGKTTDESIEGLECRKTDVKNQQHSFYFAATDPPTSGIEELHIKVEYFKQNATPILLYLSSSDQNEFDREAVQVDINVLDESGWREASFAFSVASLASALSRQPAFKVVNASNEEDICVRLVIASWLEEEE